MNKGARSKIKRSKNLLMNSTYVIKESDLKSKEPSTNISGKRFEMLKRRLDKLLAEKQAWNKKNKGLSESIEEERKLKESLKKEILSVKKLHKEAVIAKNLYEAQQNKIVQTMVANLQDTNRIFPHLIGLSECLTKNKIMTVKFLDTFGLANRESLHRKSNANDKCVKAVKTNQKAANAHRRNKSESYTDKPTRKSPRVRRSCKK